LQSSPYAVKADKLVLDTEVMRFFAAAQCVLVLIFAYVGCAGAQTPKAFAPSAEDVHPLLPAGDGRDLMIRTCSQCHDPDRAAKERRTFPEFQDLMAEMQTNGLQASDADLDAIAHYLANSFPPSLPLPPATKK
jgi:mono/diheme cytochrome c family protein